MVFIGVVLQTSCELAELLERAIKKLMSAKITLEMKTYLAPVTRYDQNPSRFNLTAYIFRLV